jgi:hypothetical protein
MFGPLVIVLSMCAPFAGPSISSGLCKSMMLVVLGINWFFLICGDVDR